MDKIHFKFIKQMLSDCDVVKALALSIFVKMNTVSSTVNRCTVNKLHELTGLHSNTIKKRMKTLQEMELLICGQNNNVTFITLQSSCKKRNVLFDFTKYKSVSELEYVLYSLLLKDVLSKKEYMKKEIDEGRESYTDTLIDQKISELQHQNDEAAEQRQRQIDIAQSQLDHYVETGEIWNNVYSLMENGIGADGIIPGSELEKLLKDNEDWAGKSVMEQLQWGNELKDTAAQAIQYLKVGNATESLIATGELKTGQNIKFTTSDGKTLNGKLNENGDIVADFASGKRQFNKTL